MTGLDIVVINHSGLENPVEAGWRVRKMRHAAMAIERRDKTMRWQGKEFLPRRE
jgi:hypothetical protein